MHRRRAGGMEPVAEPLPESARAAADGIAAANREMLAQHLATLTRRRDQARTRQQLAVIDDLIAALEERNLRGPSAVDRATRSWVRRVEEEVAVPVPRRVLRARSTARLHGALLDWMETVFEQLIPDGRNRPRQPML